MPSIVAAMGILKRRDADQAPRLEAGLGKPASKGCQATADCGFLPEA